MTGPGYVGFPIVTVTGLPDHTYPKVDDPSYYVETVQPRSLIGTVLRVRFDVSHVKVGYESSGAPAFIWRGFNGEATYLGNPELYLVDPSNVLVDGQPATDSDQIASTVDATHLEFDLTVVVHQDTIGDYSGGGVQVTSPDFRDDGSLQQYSTFYAWFWRYPNKLPLRQRQRTDGLAISAPRGFTRNRPKSKQFSVRSGWSGTHL